MVILRKQPTWQVASSERRRHISSPHDEHDPFFDFGTPGKTPSPTSFQLGLDTVYVEAERSRNPPQKYFFLNFSLAFTREVAVNAFPLCLETEAWAPPHNGATVEDN